MAFDEGKLVNNLVKDLQPVSPWQLSQFKVIFYLGIYLAIITALFILVDDFRPQFAKQLLNWRFFVEVFLLTTGFGLAGHLYFASIIPGRLNEDTRALISWVPVLLFLCMWAWSFISPPITPSMLGKRPLCSYEIIAYGALGGLTLFLWAKQAAVTNPFRTAMFVGVTAGCLPTAIMQMACMYDPTHNLLFHALPMLFVVFLATSLGLRILRW